MRVVVVPCLSDNYAYLVAADGSDDAIVIDPSEADPVLDAAAREQLRIVAIVDTHHHHDHVGGNEALVERLGAIPVYAHMTDVGRVPRQTERVTEGKPFTCAGLSFEPFHVPGHTLGAVTYVVRDPKAPTAPAAAFTGDTLFVAGCGRLFEGTPAMMHESLTKLAALPGTTKIYCGHEYTAANLRFAKHVEPDNADVAAKIDRVATARARGEPTVPSTVAEERATNPFLRCAEGTVATRYPGATPVDVFAAVRRAKDGFR